jgi:hypothetical protein
MGGFKTGSLTRTLEKCEGNANVGDNCDENTVTESSKCERRISEPSVILLKVSAATKMKRARKYDDYLELGLSWTGDETQAIPPCVTGYETFTSDSMKPSDLKRNFDNKYKECHKKPVQFFQIGAKVSKG